jgi:malonyl-CoA decarboxylase
MARAVRRMTLDCKRLLSEKGELGGMALARDLIDRLETLEDEQLDGFFDFLAADLSPDPQAVLKAARAYAETPGVATQVALTLVAEPPRQELFRRLNRMPGGTAAILRLRRALLHALPRKPELAAIEADLLDLLTSWFNPGFLQKRRVEWNSPAQLLEKIIHHEAVLAAACSPTAAASPSSTRAGRGITRSDGPPVEGMVATGEAK